MKYPMEGLSINCLSVDGGMRDGLRRCWLQWLIIALFFSASSVGWAATASDLLNRLTLPSDATLEIVSDHTIHNGIAMAIGEFSSTLPTDEVLSFYQQQWHTADNSELPGFMESSTPDWLMISRLQDNHQVLVQLSAEQSPGSSGFVSIMPIRKPLQTQNNGIFSSLSLLSSNSSKDGADASNMRVFASPSSVSATHTRYRNRLIGKGWSVLMDEAVDTGKIMILARDQTRLELSFLASPEYASVLVAHEVESK